MYDGPLEIIALEKGNKRKRYSVEKLK